MPRMSSYDELHDLPRVPHAEGSTRAPVQTGVGGNPPDKMYARGEAVDLSVAAARFKSRRSGEMPPIPGGLDDEDPRLYNKQDNAGPFSKMKVAQRSALTPEDVERLKSGRAEKADVPADTPDSGPRAAEVHGSGQEVFVPSPSGDELVDTRRGDLFLDMGGPAGKVDRDISVEPEPAVQPVKYVYVEKPVEKVVEKVVEVDRETEASKWLKRRTRVEIALPGTTFTVSAIAAIRSIHAITVILPTSGDAMTFIPRTGTEVTIRPQGGDPVDTIFTGASFDIPELGVMGLAFLIPKKES